MCGIAGILCDAVNARYLPNIAAMSETLSHRGPDDEGYALLGPAGQPRTWGGGDTPQTVVEWDAPSAPKRLTPPQFPDAPALVLGHRRLSILDLSPAGHQPMCTPDSRHWLVYNGEIYNYLELRAELESLGRSFTSTGDTEVLLAALTTWGTAALDRLEGMFALAFYDCRQQTLLLARDPFGIKPLYWSAAPGLFAFASETGSLLTLPWVDRAGNAAAAARYLAVQPQDHGEETFFAAVRSLPAGCLMELKLSDPAPGPVRRWYDPAPGPRLRISFADAARRLRELFLESVSRHMRSDIPIGAALSGGIDSSAIVMAMRDHAPQGDLRTFSFVPASGGVSEQRWMDIVAQASGAHAAFAKPNLHDLTTDIEELVIRQGEPFGSTSICAQYRVMRLAGESGIRVMLDGQGADELLAGYRPYLASRLLSLVWSLEWVAARRLWRGMARLPGADRTGWLLRAGKLALPGVAEKLARAALGKGELPAWVQTGWLAAHGALPGPDAAPGAKRNALKAELADSLRRSYLPALLRYEDRNSMAFSIESRLPFLTPTLERFIARLPEAYLISPDGESKSVFREAMRGLVPDAVLDRRDKVGFATPEALWLEGMQDWAQGNLGTQAAARLPMLDVPALERAVTSASPASANQTWRGLNLAAWARAFGVEYAS